MLSVLNVLSTASEKRQLAPNRLRKRTVGSRPRTRRGKSFPNINSAIGPDRGGKLPLGATDGNGGNRTFETFGPAIAWTQFNTMTFVL